MPYRLHALAHEEYIEAYQWYEVKQSGLGDRFMLSVEKRLQQISQHPEYFGKRHYHFREAKVPNFPYTKYMNFLSEKK